MAIDGRINVDALFHDSDGTASLKVVSLASSVGYTTGKVVHVTGTAGTSGVTINFGTYRNAAGSLVTLATPLRLAFAWSGSERRTLNDGGDDAWKLISSNGEVTVTQMADSEPIPMLAQGSGTGTYTVVMWGSN
jgi:hypothetical protein